MNASTNKKLALSGYGKMGHEVEKLALDYGFEILHIIDNPEEWALNSEKIKHADVIIDFTAPDQVKQNFINALNLSVPIVIGTTGWHSDLEEYKSICLEKNGTAIYGSNFSIGMNIMFKVNSYLASLMSPFNEYQVYMEEIHHTKKLDHPSGTAITLASQIINQYPNLTQWVESESLTEKDKFPIKVIRQGNVPGTHSIHYQSDVDKIELKHEAFNRIGFAKGALYAANWIVGKKGFYNFGDILFESVPE